jgi:hypothetical protein
LDLRVRRHDPKQTGPAKIFAIVGELARTSGNAARSAQPRMPSSFRTSGRASRASGNCFGLNDPHPKALDKFLHLIAAQGLPPAHNLEKRAHDFGRYPEALTLNAAD